MTYYHHHGCHNHYQPEYKSYEFTAFAESDLVNGNLNCGDKFTMPSNASTCITVKDDDRYLSGDGRCWGNDNATDRRGQQAAIEVNGEEVGNGGQIYAEKYFWVSDENGNWYVMIEIEQEGSSEDFFTFYTGGCYDVPPAGACLTVHSGCDIRGEWLDYKCMDAGDCEPEPGSLSGRYFCDDNDDGVDNGEPGIEGKLVTLLDSDGNVVATTTTDSDGNYRFDDLAEGDYSVMFEDSLAEGKEFIASNVGSDDTIDSDVTDPANGKTAPVSVKSGEETKDVDAGVKETDPMTGQIGDTVWLDSYGDGILNDEALDPFFSGSEPGVEGVLVQLKDAATGDVLSEQLTDADGKYLFTGLKAGAYVVGFVLPDGFAFTTADAGSDDARDSDADTTTGMTDVINLPAGGEILTVDAGLLRCGVITGTSQSDPDSPVGGYDLLVGCDEADIIKGLSGDDTLIGNKGDDELFGEEYDDNLFGGEGNDSLYGGSENDVLEGGIGDDIIDGNGERDTAVFSGNFDDATIEVVNLFTGELLVTSADGTDIVRNVEVLRFADGDVEVDSLLPGGSRDMVAAPASPGGSVNIDVLANDIELSEGTLEVVQVNNGGLGNVVLEADGTVTYTAGSDFDGYDFFTYTVSNGIGFVRTVEVQVGDRPDLASEAGVIILPDFLGEDGNEFIGTAGDDLILGGTGYDTILGGLGADKIDGGKGDDDLRGYIDTDVVLGGDGDDDIMLDFENDIGFGEEGNDQILGLDGSDILFGGNGNDKVFGARGSDFVAGGDGNDFFDAFYTGSDVALGGAGNDRFVWREEIVAGERDFVDGESGNDRLEIQLDAATDEVAVQTEIDAYLAIVAANEPPAGSINDGSVLTDTFSFASIDLDIRNVEDVVLI